MKQIEGKRAMEIHRYKLHTASPTIDTAEPKSVSLAHMRRNRKREQIEEQKYQGIDRDNQILLSRMRHIVNTDQKNASYNMQELSFHPGSLNYRIRKLRDRQIRKQNEGFIKRLCASKSVYAKDEVKPSHFQPHFLPKLNLRKVTACDNQTAKSPSSLQQHSARHIATFENPSVQSNFTLGSLSARDASKTFQKNHAYTAPRPPLRSAVHPGPRLATSTLNSIRGLPPPVESPGELYVIAREAVKCQGRYAVATIKQPQATPYLWDVEFHVPDDAATYTTQLSVDSAAEWLGITRNELMGSGGRIVRHTGNKFVRKLTKARNMHLRTLLRCYELVPCSEDSSDVVLKQSSEPCDGSRPAKVPRLTRSAADVAAEIHELARSSIDSSGAKDYSNSNFPPTRARSSGNQTATVNTLEAASQVAAKPAQKLQMCLKNTIAGGSASAFFQRYDADRHGFLHVTFFKTVIRRHCKLSVAEVTEQELNLITALMEDSSKIGTINLDTLIAFAYKGLPDAVIISSGRREATAARIASLVALSTSVDEDRLASHASEIDNAACDRPEGEQRRCNTQDGVLICAEADTAKSRPLQGPRSKARKDMVNRFGRGIVSNTRPQLSITAAYAAPPSKLIAPKSPRYNSNNPGRNEHKSMHNRVTTHRQITSPSTHSVAGSLLTALNDVARQSPNGLLTRADIVRVIRDVWRTSREDFSDNELERLMQHFKLDSKGRVSITTIKRILADDKTLAPPPLPAPVDIKTKPPVCKGIGYVQSELSKKPASNGPYVDGPINSAHGNIENEIVL